MEVEGFIEYPYIHAYISADFLGTCYRFFGRCVEIQKMHAPKIQGRVFLRSAKRCRQPPHRCALLGDPESGKQISNIEQPNSKIETT